jgi:kynurenine formamidase
MSATAANEIGNLALIDDAKRRCALSWAPRGGMYDLGHALDERVPVFPGRYFKQTLVTTAHHANPGGGVGENEVNWITELISGTMQLGTHLDALSHLQMGDSGYGGFTVRELAGTAGVNHLGVETVPQIVTCGWLVDVPGLEPGGVIRPEDCRHIDPKPGDAVLFHTGWGQHWNEPDTYLSGEPGPGCELAQWLADRLTPTAPIT